MHKKQTCTPTFTQTSALTYMYTYVFMSSIILVNDTHFCPFPNLQCNEHTLNEKSGSCSL